MLKGLKVPQKISFLKFLKIWWNFFPNFNPEFNFQHSSILLRSNSAETSCRVFETESWMIGVIRVVSFHFFSWAKRWWRTGYGLSLLNWGGGRGFRPLKVVKWRWVWRQRWWWSERSVKQLRSTAWLLSLVVDSLSLRRTGCRSSMKNVLKISKQEEFFENIETLSFCFSFWNISVKNFCLRLSSFDFLSFKNSTKNSSVVDFSNVNFYSFRDLISSNVLV